MPLIVGALALGIVTVFQLQSGVSNRLAHTADAQVVSTNFARDVVGAAWVTTQTSSSPECGVSAGAAQLLGIQSGLEYTSGGDAGFYPTITSYVLVPIGSGPTTTYSLVRNVCTLGSPVSQTVPGSYSVTSQTTLAYDVAAGQAPPSISCVANPTSPCAGVTSGWLSAQNVQLVTFSIDDPNHNYQYTLNASPVANTSVINNGPPAGSTTTSCNFATPGTGTYASTLCFVDFSTLTAADITAAQNGCVELEVSVGNNDTLYFCLSLAGAPVASAALPTYAQAFLGNNLGGTPFYSGIAGEPAIYQTQAARSLTSTVTFSGIQVVNSNGVAATGWEAVSADAESTDGGESIVWTSNAALNVVPNGESGQIQPMGNACLDDGSLPNGATGLTVSNNGTTISCSGTVTLGGHTYNVTGGDKKGTAMVYATAPTSMTVTLNGGGLEGITFGLMLS